MVLTQEELKTIFVDRSGILAVQEFDALVKTAADVRRPLLQLLMERSVVSPRYFLELLKEYFGVPSTELKVADINLEALRTISEAFATEHLIIPFSRERDTLNVAAAYPRDEELVSLLERTTHAKVQLFVATEQAIKRALVLYRGTIREALTQALGEALRESPSADTHLTSEAPPVVKLLDACIDGAILIEASDIHFEPFDSEVIVRFRVDGLLRTVASIPKTFHAGLIARLKVLSSLRIDEHRLPQDGRFSTAVKGQLADIRLSIVPSFWGEKAVLRVLPKEANFFDLAGLGLLEWDMKLLTQYLQRPYGMMLVCGPTGSGKTTTLYAFLQKIGIERVDVVNISTIEDPIEYTVPRVTQIQIQPDINLTFAVGLRSLLRQDPDIIMVGEIRDNDTADIAARAALIGRLLFSSLHTNDAIGVVPRLLDMGVEPYMVSSTLTLVIAQRLIRKLCMRCRESYQLTPETLELLKAHGDLAEATAILQKVEIVGKGEHPFGDVRFFRAKGCPQCDHTGYQGRTGVFEILEVSDEMRTQISLRKDIVSLKELARAEGMKTLFIDGLAKAVLGITDIDEVLRTTL